MPCLTICETFLYGTSKNPSSAVMNSCCRDGKGDGDDDRREKMKHSLVWTSWRANILTRGETKIGLPVPIEAGNCALEEATDKLVPGKEKLDIPKGVVASKDKVDMSWVKTAFTIEAVNNSRDKSGPEDDPSTIPAEPPKEEPLDWRDKAPSLSFLDWWPCQNKCSNCCELCVSEEWTHYSFWRK